MKFRGAPLDDVHLETLSWLDDTNRPWTRSLRLAVNTLYRVHRSTLLWVICLCWKHPKRRDAA